MEELSDVEHDELVAFLQAEGARMKVSPEAKAALKLAREESLERISQGKKD